MIQKEAWPLYRTIPGVRLWRQLKEPKPKGCDPRCISLQNQTDAGACAWPPTPRLRDIGAIGSTDVSAIGLTTDAILYTRGPECDLKGSMAYLQKQFRCPPMLGAPRT